MNSVKPFLKWAGGKGQLLGEISSYYTFGKDITKYAEPFVGGGAVLFDILSKLKNVRIECADYIASADFIDSHTFVYFDPPYRPLTETASFISYSENLFTDKSQIELAEYARSLNKRS